MPIYDNDIARFLAGRMAAEDPAAAEAAAFLQRLDSVRPTASTAAFDADQLAAVIEEARQIRIATALRTNTVAVPVRAPRLAIAALAAALIALTTGVGVAAAINGGPASKTLPAELVSVAPQPTPAAPSPSETLQKDDRVVDLVQQGPAPHPAAPKPHKASPAPKPSDTPKHESDHEDSNDGSDSGEHAGGH
jgi:hypothetical protein